MVVVGTGVVMGSKIRLVVIAHLYSGHGTPGVQTGLTHLSSTGAAVMKDAFKRTRKLRTPNLFCICKLKVSRSPII